MPEVLENFSVKQLNTFGVDATARYYVEINSVNDLRTLFADQRWQNVERMIIGGGSNMLFTRNYEGLLIRMNIKGIVQEVQGDDVLVTAGGGEVWNDLVNYCVERGFAGMENLTLIPGSVGASPIQNIGAYGVELKDVFFSCEAYDIGSGEMRTFTNADCQFDYRDSIFKRELKEKVIITAVTYKLSTVPSLNTSYGAISSELARRGIKSPSIKDISRVVADIRVSKLPDPSTIGNAGSFFKNPIISEEEFRQIQSTFPDTVHYCLSNSTVKLAAGWLIEQCGWKGKKVGETGTWKNQALVLVNHGKATGSEVYALSEAIIQSVKEKFGVVLEREVNMI
ncbi:UDP-N-acetylmuramate dehydrogenase [Pedobacter sp. SYSU D00535]|uniref:UDP-N-acetylmuramate dehydrogenase n=1 Tax=Pedobacter sp. SYSU D00535 TaxID=2810308 RepID=UPI001A95FFFA|nr:UDP-N-acetylmuramate dehydrogenase [Pedobacter sp. SYSU D00535]